MPNEAKRSGIPAGCAVEERTIPFPQGSLRACVYRPDGPSGAERAGLVFFHGGRFVGGDPGSHDALCARLSLGAGCVIVSSAYRLAPEHRFPRALDDAYFATSFVHEHADEFGIDHRRLGVGGVEVGAGLATSVARLAKERRNPALALQLLIAPCVDLRDGAGPYATAAECEDPRCSPILARNLIGLPPVILACGDDDPLRAQADAYEARLTEVQVSVRAFRGAGAGADFMTAAQAPESAVLRACTQALEHLLGAGARS